MALLRRPVAILPKIAAMFSRRADARQLLLDDAAGGVMDSKLLMLLDFMYKVELFRKLEPEEVMELARAFEEREASDGERIVCQGEEGRELFFIESGSVSVRSKEREITVLNPGDYFGEAALLQQAPRNASVYAIGDVSLRCLSREQFEEFDLQRKLNLEVRNCNVNGLQELLGGLVTTKTFCKATLIIGIYFLVAILIFSNLEGGDGMDVVYFSIITLMTAG